jgi:hypothetical protein
LLDDDTDEESQKASLYFSARVLANVDYCRKTPSWEEPRGQFFNKTKRRDAAPPEIIGHMYYYFY